MDDAFREQVALVTGASRGLGYALAREIGQRGAHVIALARTVGGLEELDDAIQEAGGAATLVPVDLTDDPALERLGAAIHERWGRLDLWAHTAVHAPPLAPAEHIDAKELDRSLALNLRATQRLIRVLDPLLRAAPRGRAVFFRDQGATGQPFHATYTAAKAGQAEIVQAWAQGIEKITDVRILWESPPPMPTALRLRFHPGENAATLTSCAEVAAGIAARLAASA